MSNITGTVRARLETPTDPIIHNVTAINANQEYSQVLTDCKKFLIRARGNSKLIFYFDSGAADWINVPRGTTYTADQINFSGTIFFKADKPGEVVEILEWV